MSDKAFDDLFNLFYKKIPAETVMHDCAVAYVQRTAPDDMTPEDFLLMYKYAMKRMFIAQMTGKTDIIQFI